LIARLIALSARHRLTVIVIVGLAAAAGIWSLRRTSLDAIPDLSDVQVTVFTEWMGRSPDLVEVLGAVRAGITHFVIPRANEADLEDLPAEVRERIEVTGVDTLAEALAITLRNTTLRDGRLFFGDHRGVDISQLAH